MLAGGSGSIEHKNFQRTFSGVEDDLGLRGLEIDGPARVAPPAELAVESVELVEMRCQRAIAIAPCAFAEFGVRV